MMKNVVKLLSLLAFCTQLSYADDLMDGLSAYERNDLGMLQSCKYVRFWAWHL